MSFLKTMFASMLGTLIVIVVLSFIGFVIVMGAVLAITSEEEVVISGKSVLYIDFSKPIADRSDDMPFYIFPMGSSPELGLNEILASVAKAKGDENISGIFLNTENVTAGLATLQEIREALADFRGSGKFVVSYGNYYTQGAYYLASVADLLALNPGGGILFKGLNAQLMFLKGALDKLDVDVQVIRHGKFKAASEPLFLDKMSPENREQITAMISAMWDNVTGAISSSRNISPAVLNQIADGLLVRTAGDAAGYRLVDTLLYKDQLLAHFRRLLELDSTARIPFVSLESYMNVPEVIKPAARDRIAVVYVSGDIVDGEGTQDNSGGERISRAIRKAREDKRVKAIVLRVNSGGGSALASEVIWRETFLAAKEKPVVASFGDVAASGGYYIGCAATTIVAGPATITGSIGVWAAIPNLQGLMNNKLGITFDNAMTNRNADFISVMKPLPAYQKAILQNEVDRIYGMFAERVASGRNIPVGKVDSIGQGRIWSGAEALKIHLTDTLGGLGTAIRLAASQAGITDYRISSLPVLRNPIDLLIEQLTGRSTPDVYLKETLGDDYIYYQTLKKIRDLEGVQARLPVEIIVN